MSAATMNEMERLRRERDEARTERDALAAHVERLREGLHQALVHWGANVADEDGTAYVECEKRCDESPESSLARLKAQWAQEGARAAAQAIRMDYEGAIHADDIADFVDEIADDYRRQSEGGE